MGQMRKNEGYCVCCKAKRVMIYAEEVFMKNGRKAIKGFCSKCKSGMYRILPVKITREI